MQIPLRLLLLDAIGTLLAAVGVAGLVSDLSGPLPLLADKNVAGAMAAGGIAVMAVAMLKIIRHLRAPRDRRAERT